MDFFDHQDVARRKTGRLVILFILAVVAIIALVYVAVVICLDLNRDPQTAAPNIWNPVLFAYISGGVALLVGGSSLYKISQLAGGGHVVAEQLGGRLLDHSNTTDLHEQKLLNVVEEMALASGMPVPPVYLIDEDGINAFAAGFSPKDAVIGVTRGAVETLNRDELQGVIAHEFSHILNGDMRLNIRLMGVIFGISALTVIGYYMFRGLAHSSSSRRSDKKGNAAPFLLLAVALMIIGAVGSFFANLIKAAVSRQREFLADASAVQFTRSPDGISGALRKIGGWVSGSKLTHPDTAEVSHMLFGDGVSRFVGGIFATHPPLDERIRRIDPSFDGQFPATMALTAGEERAMGFAGPSRPSAAPAQIQPDAVSQIGNPTAAHVTYAATLLADLPGQVKQMAREPYGARALIYALLLDENAAVSMKQMQTLADGADEPVRRATLALWPLMKQISEASRLPLLDLAMPALRQLSPQQYGQFKDNVEQLVRADQRVTVFEWALQRILLTHLEPQFNGLRKGGAKATAVKHHSLIPVAEHCAALLCTLAYAGQSDQAAAMRSLDLGRAELGLTNLPLLTVEQCGLRTLSAAIDELTLVAPQEKRKLVRACAATISADQKVTVREAELFRAICDSLGAPAPPLLPGQKLA